jgi:hypothetical protein
MIPEIINERGKLQLGDVTPSVIPVDAPRLQPKIKQRVPMLPIKK